MRITEALDVVRRESQSVLLHRSECGCGSECHRVERRRSQSAEVEQSREVQLEVGIDVDPVEVATELDQMMAMVPRDRIADLITVLDPLHRREQLATDECRAGDVEGDRVTVCRAERCRATAPVEVAFV